MTSPEPLDPEQASDLLHQEETKEGEIYSFQYRHVDHSEDTSLEVSSIDSIHAQVITWYDTGTKKVKRIVIQHQPENLLHSPNVNLSDGTFPRESCPCQSNRDPYIWVFTGTELEKINWSQVDVERVDSDDREEIAHLLSTTDKQAPQS